MNEFLNVLKTERMEILDHSIEVGFRRQDTSFRMEASQRWAMKVVPMEMGQINEIGSKSLDQLSRGRRIIPPGPPVTTAHEPRIDQDGAIACFHEKPCMADDRKFHEGVLV